MATSDIHLKLEGIEGESKDDGHVGQIDIDAWSWGASNPGGMEHGGGGGMGRVSFSDLTFVHRVDKASPNLWRACALGEHIKEATLASAKQGKGQQEFLTLKLTDVIITSVSTSGSGGGSVPMENVSMQFAKVDMAYRPQKLDGSLDAPIPFKYDIKAHKQG